MFEKVKRVFSLFCSRHSLSKEQIPNPGVSQHGVRLSSEIVSAESDSKQCWSLRNASHIFCEYLRKNESFNKTILAYLLGGQVGSIHEIKNTKKISRHCHFKCSFLITKMIFSCPKQGFVGNNDRVYSDKALSILCCIQFTSSVL